MDIAFDNAAGQMEGTPLPGIDAVKQILIQNNTPLEILSRLFRAYPNIFLGIKRI
jgi:hypothetical protein